MRIQRLYIIPAAILAMVNLLFAGCSEQVSPPNIEPVITLLEPSDISRTDATLGVTIKNWEGLSYIRFKFGESGKTGLESGRLTTVAETMTYHLTGLTPSTTYFYMAEGGNDKAIVRTPEMTFTTNPY
ncbi:MAG: hypothetical protein K2G69_07590, partial [Muribaculaceae bacterium]|nr:hypothetical protein [Muribaculaceae bacterium]